MLNKKLALKFLLFFCLFTFFLSHSLFAQQEQKTGIITADDTDDDTLGYWHEHFGLRAGITYTYGLDKLSSRSYTYASLQWKDDFDWISFNVEGLASRRDFRYALTFSLKDNKALDKNIQGSYGKFIDTTTGTPPATPVSVDMICSDDASLLGTDISDEANAIRFACLNRTRFLQDLNIDLKISDDEFIWREAHLKFNIGEELEILLGWHTIVWGQHEFISPVDFVLPFRLGSSGFSLGKAESRNPQQAAILYYFPVPWVELQAYFFPDLGIDSAFLDSIAQGATLDNDGVNYRIDDFYHPEGSDKYRYAARALFYLDKLTIGFTYYEGFFQFDADRNLSLTLGEDDNYFIEGSPSLQPIKVYGIEIAYPVDKWVYKIDASSFKIKQDLFLEVEEYNNQRNNYIEKDEFFDAKGVYVDWILNQNNGRMFIDETLVIATFGVDANLDNWLLNLGILTFYSKKSANAERGEELYTATFPPEEGIFADTSISFIPTINLAYYLDDEKKDALGLAFGLLNTGFGFVAYITQDYFEYLRVGLSLEYLGLFSNGLVQEEGYELESPAYPGIGFLVDYKL